MIVKSKAFVVAGLVLGWLISKINRRNIFQILLFCKFLAGSFSAVSKRNVASKHAFDSIFVNEEEVSRSIFQALQDVHTFAQLKVQHFSKNNLV